MLSMRSQLTTQAARWVRDRMIRAGPGYVKLGQLVGMREDLVGKPTATVLRELCRNVPPMEFEQVVAIIRAEQPRIASVSRAPIAAGSVGQVHRARIATEGGGGATVAVKVGDAWRVDPSALASAMNNGEMRQAA